LVKIQKLKKENDKEELIKPLTIFILFHHVLRDPSNALFYEVRQNDSVHSGRVT